MKNLKYAVGDVVYTKYGVGIVKKVDEKDRRFTYFVACGDGTRMWCHEDDLSDKPLVKPAKKA